MIDVEIGLANLAHLPRILEQCRKNAAHFNSELIQLPGIMQLAELPVGTQSSWWLYTIRVPASWRARFCSRSRVDAELLRWALGPTFDLGQADVNRAPAF